MICHLKELVDLMVLVVAWEDHEEVTICTWVVEFFHQILGQMVLELLVLVNKILAGSCFLYLRMHPALYLLKVFLLIAQMREAARILYFYDSGFKTSYTNINRVRRLRMFTVL